MSFEREQRLRKLVDRILYLRDRAVSRLRSRGESHLAAKEWAQRTPRVRAVQRSLRHASVQNAIGDEVRRNS